MQIIWRMEGVSGSQVILVFDIACGQDTDMYINVNEATNVETNNNVVHKTNCNILMNHFKALVTIESTNDLFERVSDASVYLSGVTPV